MKKKKLFQKTLGFLPRGPGKRYNVFMGTTSFSEWTLGLKIWLKRGPVDDKHAIEKYEKKFSEAVGTMHGISFGSGRMTLYSILQALGMQPGDEIIVPAFTCVVVPNAIIYSGVRPLYVDVNLRDFNISVEKIEKEITPKTVAIYAQHTFGVPCDMVRINKIAKTYNLKVIEDCAHALGGNIDGTMIGAHSDVAFFSTDHSKTITTYLGGIATTNNDEIADKLRNIQSDAPFLPKKDVLKIIRAFLLEWIYFSPYLLWIGLLIHKIFIKLGLSYTFRDELQITKPTDYPYPCSLSSQQAQLGYAQLERLKTNVLHRQAIAAWLQEELQCYNLSNDAVHQISWIRYSFLVNNRDKFIDMFSRKFDLGIWFMTIFGGRDSDFDAVGYENGSCPNAEFVAKHIVNFPTHQRIPLHTFQKEVAPKLDYIRDDIIEI
jgi:perosamine synthetase